MFRISRVGHVGIRCSHVERSMRFYQETLGLKVTGWWRAEGEGPERGLCFLRAEEMHHDLVLFAAPEGADPERGDRTDTARRPGAGLHHIALEVPTREDWLQAIQRLRAQGVEFVQGPLVHGLEGDGFPGGSGSHAFYFLDPDGNRIEVYWAMMRVTGESTAAPGEVPARAELPAAGR